MTLNLQRRIGLIICIMSVGIVAITHLVNIRSMSKVKKIKYRKTEVKIMSELRDLLNLFL